MNSELRIIDANFNRSREALRVMEEYCRFMLDDEGLTRAIKTSRHELCQLIGEIPDRLLLDGRDTPGDVGTGISLATETSRSSLESVLRAATSRLSEALRAIEEYAKISYPEVAIGVEQLRYKAYDLEKVLFARLTRNKFRNVALYVLLTEELCRLDIIETASMILKAGADCIQYRQKDMAGQRTLNTVLQLAELCLEYKAVFIINDRCDLALAGAADGVHLGQDDLPPGYARQIMGQSAILGRTCHNLDEVSLARQEDVDYIGIGSIFGSPTKPSVPRTGTEFITAARKLYAGPIVAIGGVTAENAGHAIRAGADAVAVCQAIISDPQPGKAAEIIKSVIDNAKSR